MRRGPSSCTSAGSALRTSHRRDSVRPQSPNRTQSSALSGRRILMDNAFQCSAMAAAVRVTRSFRRDKSETPTSGEEDRLRRRLLAQIGTIIRGPMIGRPWESGRPTRCESESPDLRKSFARTPRADGYPEPHTCDHGAPCKRSNVCGVCCSALLGDLEPRSVRGLLHRLRSNPSRSCVLGVSRVSEPIHAHEHSIWCAWTGHAMRGSTVLALRPDYSGVNG